MAYTGISGSAILIMLLLLLTASRWRHWSASLISAALIASLAIANEIAFLLTGLGFVITVLAWMVVRRSIKLPRELLIWIGTLGAAAALAVLQGGMLTEIVRARFGLALSAVEGSRPEAGSYFDTSPSLVWPPSIISAHLGSLSIFNPAQLAAALAEIGPIVLVTPLVFIWAWKSLRLGKWYEASLIAASFGSLIALFVAFKGPLFTATPRLMGGWFFACTLYAVPLLWIWARQRSGSLQAVAVFGGLIAAFSGLVLFGVQLTAIQKPVYATFITPLDARMSQEYWDRLEANARVFDPSTFRAPTVFGRFTDSSPTWYARSPGWEALVDAPDPIQLHAAGFSYMYFDRDYWEALTPEQQSALQASCVKQVAQVDGIHSEKDYTKDFRRLLDIRDCK